MEADRDYGWRKDRKNHLTYGQGAAPETTAMATIGAADYLNHALGRIVLAFLQLAI